MGSPMEEAFRNLVDAIQTDDPDTKDPEEQVRQLVESLPSVLRAFDSQHRTPLHHAALLGRDTILRVILDVGPESDIDVRDEDGCTPLHLAARSGHDAVVSTLIRKGASVRAEESFGETPLHEAARSGYASVVRILISDGAVVDSPNQDRSTALHIAARRGHEAAIQTLLDAGANPQTRDAVGDTPLHDAARGGHEKVVQMLLETGLVSVDAQNDNDLTSLSVASRHGKEGIVRILVEHGADLDSVSSDYCTPLHQAASEGHDGVVRILIAAGADMDLQDKDDQTPLHAAVIFEHEAVVQSLLAADADVNIRDNEDCTPLHHAVKNENKPMVRDLLEAGADPTVISTSGETPQSLAKLLNRNSIADLFNSPQVVPKLSAPSNFRPRRVRPPTKPNREHEVDVCKHFSGLFWSPTSDRSFDSLSMWDILYDPETELKLNPRPPRISTSPIRPKEKPEVHTRKTSYSRKDEKPIKRWFHLPANNISWVMDLVQKICAMDHKSESDCNRIMGFIEETFHEVRISVPYRRPHFKRETKGEEGSPSSGMFSLVLPVIDVEIDDKTKCNLQDIANDEAQLRPRELLGTKTNRHTLSAMPTNLQHYLFPHLVHFDAMDKLKTCFTKSELHVPRALDQSYHESLSAEDLLSRNESQVLYRYLKRLEETNPGSKTDAVAANEQPRTNATALQDPFERRAHRTLSQQSSSKQKKTDGTKAELMRMTGRPENDSSVQARMSREKKRVEQDHRKQLLMVSQLWLWRIDEHNIISAFPERWDNKNAKTLLNEIKHRILSMRDLRSEDTDMSRVVESVLDRAVGFSEEEFHFQFDGPKSYCNVFAGSIAHVSNEAMKRYTNFKASISHMGTSKTVLNDLKDEIELLQEIDDILDEINMIKRVLREQERVLSEFHSSKGSRPSLHGPQESDFSHPTLDFFHRLEEDANRVRDSITTLLDLRQREANIEEALSANEQSKILFIFTGATVVFAPLSWIMALLAVKIDGLPEPLSVRTIALACLGSLLGTFVLIALSLPLHDLMSHSGETSKRLRKLFGRGVGSVKEEGPPTPPETSAQQTQVRRSSISQVVPSTTAANGNRLRRRILGLARDRNKGDEEKGLE